MTAPVLLQWLALLEHRAVEMCTCHTVRFKLWTSSHDAVELSRECGEILMWQVGTPKIGVQVILFGGATHEGQLGDTWHLDLQQQRWDLVNEQQKDSRAWHSLALTTSPEVLPLVKTVAVSNDLKFYRATHRQKLPRISPCNVFAKPLLASLVRCGTLEEQGMADGMAEHGVNGEGKSRGPSTGFSLAFCVESPHYNLCLQVTRDPLKGPCPMVERL